MKNTKRLHNTLFIAFALLISACSSNKKLIAEKINYIYVDYDIYTPNNIGQPFPGTISAQLFSGESIKLGNNKGFNSSENFHAQIKQEQLVVFGPLPDYKTSKIPVSIEFTDRFENKISANDTVILNFRGDTKVNYSGAKGHNGGNGDDGTTPWLLTEGKPGGQGGTGQDGGNGENLEIHCWQRFDTIFIHVLNTTRNSVWKTMLVGETSTFSAITNGAQGGIGGEGGDGGTGKAGSGGTRPKEPGRGGAGGPGGYGGRGGAGGNIKIYLHTSVKNAEKQILLQNYGGAGGNGGEGGKGGKAGAPASGQTATTNGGQGATGPRGAQGMNGQVFQIVEDFDTTVY